MNEITDRELLELAAKAVGLEVIKHCQEARDKAGYGYVGLYVKSNQGELISTGWNPITDDGHALRLAVDLNIAFRNLGHVMTAIGSSGQFNEYADGDAYAATRYAITRAAAEIGRAMK